MNDNKVKICLNMIVKNESKIITRLFDSVISIIDYWVISDTGSTDDTQNIIINYFKEKNIPGLLVNHEWKNFGHNRTLSLLSAQQSDFDFDYVLLLDADMKLVIGSNFTKSMLHHDVYTLKQGGYNIGYYNTRLLKKNLKVKVVSPTHEYYDILTKPHTQSHIDPSLLHIDDIGDGGSKKDKFERDIKLLKKGIEDEPNNVRYHFYLAQSYKDSDDYLNAIKYYKRRIELGGWQEEVYYSYYEIGNMYNKLKEYDKSIYNYLMAFNVNPNRAETIYEIAKYYRFQEKYVLANHFADLGRKIVNSGKLDDANTLFKSNCVYNYLLDYEKSIVCYYSGELDIGLKISNDLLLNKKHSMCYDDYECVYRNLKFYVKKFEKYGGVNLKRYYKDNLILDYDTHTDHKNIFNPSIAFIKNNMYINMRCANYNMTINNNNLEYKVYKNNELVEPNWDNPVSTINYICKMSLNLNLINSDLVKMDDYNDLFKYNYTVKGIEDMRIIEYNNSLYFIGNSREVTDNNVPRMVLGEYSLEENKIKNINMLHGYEDHKCQKNWSPFIYNNKLLLLYSFGPLVILEPNLETGLCKEYKKDIPKYNYSIFRGGSQGFYINNDLYFVVHETVYTNGRIYFHRFVKMDSDLNIEKVTYPFFFKEWGIEYVAGAVFDKKNNRVLLSWGENDNNANVSSIDVNNFQNMFY